MIVLEDVANKEGKHANKHAYFASKGITCRRVPLPIGDYILLNTAVLDVLKRKSARDIPVKKMDLIGTFHRSVDTKFSIQELISDICGKQHDRFRDELILAQNNNVELLILVEDDGDSVDRMGVFRNTPVRSLEDLLKWENPRLHIKSKGELKYPKATKGETLYKCCRTMEQKYGVRFRFCGKEDAGQKIIEFLTGEDNDQT